MWLIAISGWTLTSLALVVPVARALRFHPASAAELATTSPA